MRKRSAPPPDCCFSALSLIPPLIFHTTHIPELAPSSSGFQTAGQDPKVSCDSLAGGTQGQEGKGGSAIVFSHGIQPVAQ